MSGWSTAHKKKKTSQVAEVDPPILSTQYPEGYVPTLKPVGRLHPRIWDGKVPPPRLGGVKTFGTEQQVSLPPPPADTMACKDRVKRYKDIADLRLQAVFKKHQPQAGQKARVFQTDEFRRLIPEALAAGILTYNAQPLSSLFVLEDVSKESLSVHDRDRSMSGTMIAFGRFNFTVNHPTSQQMALDPTGLAQRVQALADRSVVLKIGFAPAKSLKKKVDASSTVHYLDDGSAVTNIYVTDLDYERRFYRDISNKLIEFGYSPHVILCYAAFEVDNIQSDMDKALANPPPLFKGLPYKAADGSDSKEKDAKQIQAYAVACALNQTIDQLKKDIDEDEGVDGAYMDKYNFDVAHILLLERSMGVSFETYFAKHATIVTDETLSSILGQVLFTLECFNQMGARHNDLHAGNIRIELNVEKRNIAYFLTEDIYLVIPTNGVFAKIFDFDNATTTLGTGMGNVGNYSMRNNDDLCNEYGICNWEANPKYDTFYLLTNLYYLFGHYLYKTPGSTRPRKTEEWLYRAVSQYTILAEKFPHKSRLCKRTAESRGYPNSSSFPVECEGNYVPPDEELQTTSFFLRQLGHLFGWIRDMSVDGFVLHPTGTSVYRLPNLPAHVVDPARLWPVVNSEFD
jgi:hypothetical protein